MIGDDPLAVDADEEARLRELMRLLRKADAAAGAEEELIGEFRIPRSRIPERHIDGIRTLTKTEAAVLRFLGWGRAICAASSKWMACANSMRSPGCSSTR